MTHVYKEPQRVETPDHKGSFVDIQNAERPVYFLHGINPWIKHLDWIIWQMHAVIHLLNAFILYRLNLVKSTFVEYSMMVKQTSRTYPGLQ